MIKLNLEKIAKLEKTHVNDYIYLNTLQRMIDIMMEPHNLIDENSSTRELALQTLTDLGVVDQQKSGKKEQLNS